MSRIRSSVPLSNCSAPSQNLHSFPTRRSSDLARQAPQVHLGTLGTLGTFSIADAGVAAFWMSIGLLFYVYLGYPDRKSTRLNSSHLVISYAVFCLKKKASTSRSVQRLGSTREQ